MIYILCEEGGLTLKTQLNWGRFGPPPSMTQPVSRLCTSNRPQRFSKQIIMKTYIPKRLYLGWPRALLVLALVIKYILNYDDLSQCSQYFSTGIFYAETEKLPHAHHSLLLLNKYTLCYDDLSQCS